MNFMKIDVPFYEQTNPLNCGTTALRMVLNYFGGDFDLDVIEHEAEIKKGKGIFTIQLGVAAMELGFGVELCSIEEGFNDGNMEKDFYKKFADPDFPKMFKGWNDRAKKLGMKFSRKSLELDELIAGISEGSVPIVLIDWNVVEGKDGYQGHFVPLVGYDEENVFVHNPSNGDGAFVKISKELFDKARKTSGTDEDILIVKKL